MEVTTMATQAKRLDRAAPEGTATVRELDPERRARRGARVVAVILEDGTVRRLDEPGDDRDGGFATGTVSGPDWVLWWERRSFDS
jgi:hypothetical protein